jgi:hypothetical protein
MRRRLRVLIVLMTIILVVTGGGWFLWKSLPRPKVPPVLVLTVNRAKEATLPSGFPLVFTVHLTGSRATPRMQVGGRGQPWYGFVRLESSDGRLLPLKSSLLGKPYSFRPQVDASGAFKDGNLYRGDEAVIEEMKFVSTMKIGIGPDEAERIPAGRYTIRAALRVSSWQPWKWSGSVTSNPVIVTVRQSAKGEPSDASLERDRLVQSAEFYSQAGRFDEAHRVALQIREREPEKAHSHLLLGDALDGLGRHKEAVKTYKHALNLYSLEKHYEPPTYLLMRLYEAEQSLKQK